MSKKTTLIIAIFFVSLLSFAGRKFTSINETILLNNAFFPTREGGINEANLLDYIEAYCKDLNLKYTKLPIQTNDYVTNSFNFEISLPGKNPSSGNLFLLVQLDSLYNEGLFYDVSISHNLAFKIIAEILKNPIDKNLIVAFIGASSHAKENLAGLENYLSRKTNRFDNSIVTLLDVINLNKPVVINGSSSTKPMPSILLENAIKVANNNSRVFTNIDDISNVRLGMFETTPKLGRLLNRDITAVEFSNSSNIHQYEESDYYNNEYELEVYEALKLWIHKLDALPKLLELDHNYQLISHVYKNKIWYRLISEKVQVIFFIIVLVIVVFLRRIVFFIKGKNAFVILSYIPTLLFIFAIFYLCSFAIFIIQGLISAILNVDLFNTLSIFFYFAIIYLSGNIITKSLVDKGTILSITFRIPNAVYLYGAIYSAYIILFIVIISQFSLIYIYSLFLIFVTLAHFVRTRYEFKFLLYSLSSLPYILTLFKLKGGTSDLLTHINYNLPLLNFIFCCSVFPFLLLSLRIHYINKLHYGSLLHSNRRIIRWGLLIFTLLLPIVVLFSGDIESSKNLYAIEIEKDYNENIERIKLDKAKHTPYARGTGNISLVDIKSEKNYPYNGSPIEIPIVKEKEYSYKIINNNHNTIIKIDSLIDISQAVFTLRTPQGTGITSSNYKYLFIESKDGYDYYTILLPKMQTRKIEVRLGLLLGYEYLLSMKLTPFDKTLDYDFTPSIGRLVVSKRIIENILIDKRLVEVR